jgi:D-tyrosyl-tRNA(Tyr) deacylase
MQAKPGRVKLICATCKGFYDNNRPEDSYFRRRGEIMRAVVQRVSRARVVVGEEAVGEIGRGLVVLLGVAKTDAAEQAVWLADKIVSLRIFQDADDNMNLGLLDVGGAVLVVSQFTLYGDCRKGRRPSFIDAAPPESAIPLYEAFINAIRAHGIPTATGRFGAMMQVELVNDGPVTLIVDSK